MQAKQVYTVFGSLPGELARGVQFHTNDWLRILHQWLRDIFRPGYQELIIGMFQRWGSSEIKHSPYLRSANGESNSLYPYPPNISCVFCTLANKNGWEMLVLDSIHGAHGRGGSAATLVLKKKLAKISLLSASITTSRVSGIRDDLKGSMQCFKTSMPK